MPKPTPPAVDGVIFRGVTDVEVQLADATVVNLALDRLDVVGQRVDLIVYEPDCSPPYVVLTGRVYPITGGFAGLDRNAWPSLPTMSPGSRRLVAIEVYRDGDVADYDAAVGARAVILDAAGELGDVTDFDAEVEEPLVVEGDVEVTDPDPQAGRLRPHHRSRTAGVWQAAATALLDDFLGQGDDELPELNTAPPTGGELGDVGALVTALDEALRDRPIEVTVIVRGGTTEVIGTVVDAGYGYVFRTAESGDRLVTAVDLGRSDVDELAKAGLVHLIDRGLDR